MAPPRQLARIRRYGAGCLRRLARESEPGAPETTELLDLMWRTLVDDGGVGLAAPQIGIDRRVVVIRDPSLPERRQRLDLVNPRLDETYGPEEPFSEGCLSFPGLYIEVWRRRGAQITYHDRDGRRQTLRDSGLIARIAQHELDHLDGVLFIDRISRLRRWALQPRLLLIMAGDLLRRRRKPARTRGPGE